MSSRAQCAREVVIALQPVMAFCHKQLSLLNKRVSMQSPAPKLKARGKRQDLTLVAMGLADQTDDILQMAENGYLFFYSLYGPITPWPSGSR